MSHRSLIILILGVFCALLGLTGSHLQAAPPAGKGPVDSGIDSPPSVSVENAYLKALSSSGGRFIIGTTGGDPGITTDDNKRLLYGYPTNVGSSFSTLRISNGVTTTDHILGDTDWTPGIAPTAPPTSSGTSLVTTWSQDGVTVLETVTLITSTVTGRADTTLIAYTITNHNAAPVNAGLRIMLDTMIGDNDGAPFFLPNAGNVTNQIEFFAGSMPDYWVAWESPLFDPDSLKGRGQLIGAGLTRPDRFVIADWPQADSSVWDYTVDPGDPVTNDSAVLLYFNPITLAPGASRTVQTQYGLAPSGSTLAPTTLVTDRVQVPVGGSEFATLTLMLRDANSHALPNHKVRLASSRGSLDTLTPVSGVTDASGRFIATIRSMTPGTAQVTAWDLSDGIPLPVSVSIEFTLAGATPPPPNQGPIAITGLTAQHPLDARYLQGIPVANRISVSVDWKGTSPGHVDFILNGTIHSEPATVSGASHTFDMGNNLQNGANHLKIVAYNTTGQASNALDYSPYSVPAPVWLDGLRQAGLLSLPVLATGDVSGKGYYKMGFHLPNEPFDIEALRFGVPDKDTKLEWSFDGDLKIPLDCTTELEAALTAGVGGFKLLGTTIDIEGSGGLRAGRTQVCAFELPHGYGGIEVKAQRNVYRKPVLVMVSYFNAAVGVAVDRIIVVLHLEEFVGKLGEFYVDGKAHFGVESQIDLVAQSPYFKFSDLELSGGLGVEGGFRADIQVVEVKVWAGADGTVKFIRMGPVTWPPTNNWDFDSITLLGEVGAKFRLFWFAHEAKGSLEWKYPPGAEGPPLTVNGLTFDDWHLIDHVTTPDYAVFANPRLDAGLALSNPITSVLVSNVYTYTEPALAVGPGVSDTLLLWVHDDVNQPVGQSLEIYHSRWDGSQWSTPAGITNDNRLDSAPQVAWTTGGDAVAVWQRLDATLPITATWDVTTAQKIEIATATYSATTQSWTPVSWLTSNGVLDMTPHLARSPSGQLLAAWRQNPAGLIAGTPTSPDRIVTAFYSGTWDSPVLAVDNLLGLSDLAVAYGHSDQALIAFTRPLTPTGGVTPTLQLFTSSWNGATWSTPLARTDSPLENRRPQVVFDAGNQPLVVWLAGDALRLLNLGSSVTATLALPAEIGNIDEFRLVQDGDGNLAAVFTAQASQRDLYLTYYDQAHNLWGKPQRLTDDRASEGYPAPGIDAQDRLLLGYAATATTPVTRTGVVTTTGQVITYTLPLEGQTDLDTLLFTPGNDLAAAGLVVGSGQPITATSATITNTVPVFIPDEQCVDGAGNYVTSEILVVDDFVVGDVDVGANLTHTYRGDLTIRLQGPDGTIVFLHNQTNGSSDNLDVLWDDQSPNGPLPSGSHNVSPPYYENWHTPAAALAAFQGKNSLGAWRLGICDNAGGDVGTLNFWTLYLDASPGDSPDLAAPTVLTATVQNTGSFALDGVEVAFYDGPPGAGGSLVDTRALVEPLAAGYTATLTTTYSVPAIPGAHRFFAVVDPNDVISETNELDNQALRVALGPDLAVTSAGAQRWGGSDVGLRVVVRNDGITSSPPATLRYYQDAINGTLAVSDIVPPLAPGAAVTVTTPWNYGPLAAGTYPLVAVVNQGEIDFTEEITANNQLAWRLDVLPDLAVDPLYLWLTPTVSNTLDVTVTVMNLGSVPAPATAAHFYRGSPLDPANLLFTRSVPGLAAGAQVDLSGSWENPPEGVQSITVWLDPERQVLELTTANNLASAEVTVPALCPDFGPPAGVDVLDLQAVVGQWGTTWGGPGWVARYDLTRDGRVDIVDVMRVAAAWGTGCGE